MKKRRAAVLWCAAMLMAATCQAETVTGFADVRNMPAAEAAQGAPVRLTGIVTFSYPGEGFVLAPSPLRDQNAVFVKSSRRVEEGEGLTATGRTIVWENVAAVEAHDIALGGRVEMGEPDLPKWQDVRKGWRNLRRARCRGEVKAVDFQRDAQGREWTYFTVFGASVRVRGRVEGEAAQVGAVIEADGITRNSFDARGRALAGWFEIASPDNVRVYAPPPSAAWMYVLLALLSVVSVAAAGFCVAYLRSRRTRKEMELVAADRRRIAADLHDTIEQHLAGVKILLSAAAKPAGVPPETRKVLHSAAELLIHAKGEVRAAVMDLRGDGKDATLAAALREIAKSGAADFRLRLAALPEWLEPARQRNLVMIVREAVTNALKHGQAKTIAMVADSGESGFVLRVLNDGEKFDADKALGAATGHFGLSGMRERAHHSDFDLSFVSDGKWCGVKIAVSS